MDDFSKAVSERRGWTSEQWDAAPPLITAAGFPPHPGESRHNYVERLKRGGRPTHRQFVLILAFTVVFVCLVVSIIRGNW